MKKLPLTQKISEPKQNRQKQKAILLKPVNWKMKRRNGKQVELTDKGWMR